ncbi:hypothetical protein SARC_09868 [Sphaeroforma arctica JP610]|uniref:Fe2OG dioxygenase domain-containing protein n=1 Tax=Sphaeroforma arctica JP610 TaxID=667725 RepID=A0A0L0FMF9_9EUKA|nr:hypothetical protein SARC_09868 [Sphaeroforma arctica JP610]KNC77676.1 hypothetical protein SARC_09868 [Sphaeroforma arctica JP610]|eukprot:XP_014151578.1 hypothetical protein SARC_09868 [Sphaeroforma arctica JP610]
MLRSRLTYLLPKPLCATQELCRTPMLPIVRNHHTRTPNTLRSTQACKSGLDTRIGTKASSTRTYAAIAFKQRHADEMVQWIDVPADKQPDGIHLANDYLTETEHTAMAAELAGLMSGVVDPFTLQPMNKRATDELASKLGQKRKMKCLHGISQLKELPATYQAIQRLEKEGLFKGAVDSLQINEYQPTHGCPPHIDAPSVGPVIAMFSLGTPTVMTLRNPREPAHTGRILLEERSCLVLSGQARGEWLHGVDGNATQPFKDQTISRGHRYSVVFWATPPKYEKALGDVENSPKTIVFKTASTSKRRF